MDRSREGVAPVRVQGGALEEPGRWLIVTAALFVLLSVDVLRPGLVDAARQDPLALLLVAFLQAAALDGVLGRVRARGVRLVASVFAAYYGPSALLVALEAAYVADVLPPAAAWALLANGAVTAAFVAVLGVAVHGGLRSRGTERTEPPAAPTRADRRRAARRLALRLPLAGAAYLVFFVTAGLALFGPLVRLFEPVAGPAYLAAFRPECSVIVLLFQFGRGTLWALLALPLVRGLRATWPDAVSVAALFGTVMASLLLLPSELLPGIRAAHTVEVFVANFAFGLIVVRLFARREGSGRARRG